MPGWLRSSFTRCATERGTRLGTAMDRKTAVAEIRKCLNLARSAEPHEAAVALREAQKLMAGFEIGECELPGAGVDEAWVKSSTSARPARFEVRLASMVAGAFGCEIVFTRRLNASGTKIFGGYAFIGVAPAEQVASYAFTVFARQLRAARAQYVAATLRRCLPRNRTARADLFCEGWVAAACLLVQPAGVSELSVIRLEEYMRAHYADTSSMTPRGRAEAVTVQRAPRISDAVPGNWLLPFAPAEGPSSYEADLTNGHPEKAHLRQRDQASSPRTCAVEQQLSGEQQSMSQETGHATVH